MPAASGGITASTSIIVFWAAPLLVYHLTLGAAPPWLVGVVAATQIAAIAGLLTWNWTPRYRAAIVVGLLVTVSAALNLPGLQPRTVGLIVAGMCHAAAYSGLLVWFCTSLRPGHEPVVTGLARRIRLTMPDKVMRYTRRVTIAWCLFFAAQLAVSAGLLLLAPTATWSMFVNLLNLPLLAAMVLAEFGCRMILFRHEPRTSLIDTLSVMRRARITPVGQP